MSQTLLIQVVLFDGFDLLDAVAPYEVFSAAAAVAPGSCNVEFVAAEGSRSVPSGMGGVPIPTTARLDPQRADVVVVPGAAGDVWGTGPSSVPALLKRAGETELAALMQQALQREDQIVATVCGGSLLLALAGLLGGRSAVTHHLGLEVLAATGVNAVRARVVDDGNLVSSGGVTSGLDLSLYLVERLLGPRVAHSVELLFEYERRGTVWKATGLLPNEEEALISQPNEPSPEKENHGPPLGQEFAGIWNVSVATPLGAMEITLVLTFENGQIQGSATQNGDRQPLMNLEVVANRLTWTLQATKPLRLRLAFSVTVDGPQMRGTVKAGIFPPSTLVGTRE